jgi:exonuclease SbcC
VEPARASVEALDAAARREAAAGEAGRQKADTANVLEGSSTQSQTTATTAEAALAVAEAERVAAGPAIQAARAADVRLLEARRRADEAAATSRLATTAAGEAGAARIAEEARLQKADGELAEIDGWLGRHAATAAVVAAWGELQVHLGVLAAETTRRTAAEAEAPALAAKAGAAEQAQAQAQEAHAARLAEAAAARAAEQGAADALAARADNEDVSLRRTQLLARRDGLARCGELLVAWRRLGAERDVERAGVATAEAAADDAERARGVAAVALTERTTRLSEARDGLRRAQAALDLTGHRAALVDGAECPLCGATEHPWSGGSPLADLVDDAHGRVAALDAEVADLVKAEAAARTGAAAETAEAGRARARVADRDTARAATAAAWTAARVAPAPEAPPDDGADALAATLTAAEADTAEALAALGREEREDARLQKAHVDAIGLAQAAATRAADAERAVGLAARAREDADRAAADTARRAAEATAAAAAALEAAAPAFPTSERWRAGATVDPTAFRAACAKEVADYGNQRDARVDAVATRGRIELALATATTAATERAAAGTLAAEAAATALAASQGAEEARAALLGGVPADTVEADLTRAAEDARHRATEARTAAHRAAEAATAGRAAATAAADEHARRGRELAEARAAVSALLLDLTVDEPTLRARLARDRHWREEARQRVADADKAVVEALTRETERARAAAAHAATDAPAEDRAAVEAALPAAEATQRAADDAWTTARAVLLEDDARRARSAGMLPAIDAQRVVSEQWKVISKLIGSASGNVFRQFAQGLTLNLLLVDANVQLAALNPRYQLQRVPNVEMELQVVDLHMAEQVRPLTSLSGGETFLVSLALALGLASLAATRTRVESIFIDEGFGTLDAETLDVALSTLEGLRAEGRTVGVISHVGGLAERLGAWVSVRKVGPGRSRVEIHTG